MKKEETTEKKTIGVIGGLGPMASVYLTELITMMTDARTDQEHPRILMYSIPDTPDRTAYLKGEGESPLPELIRAARVLEQGGAGFLVIPCVTAQHFYGDICESVSIPVVSLSADVAEDVASRGIRRVALFATDGTMKSGILEREFLRHGVDVLRPEPEEQAEVMRLIYEEVKTGEIDTAEGAVRAQKRLNELADRVIARGAERVILGCTELSLIRREAIHMRTATPGKYIDILEILAAISVNLSGATLRADSSPL